MLKSLMIVGCGSFVGGALRYLLTRTVQNWIDGWMPAGTLAVNVLGCLLIGLFCGLSQEWMPQSLKLFLTVGFWRVHHILHVYERKHANAAHFRCCRNVPKCRGQSCGWLCRTLCRLSGGATLLTCK